MGTDGHVEALPRERCWSLLREGSAGRLAFTNKALPAVVAVHYGIEGDALVLRAPTGSDWPARVAGTVVAFEVDRFAGTGELEWSVVVIGQIEQDGRDRLALDLGAALLTGERAALSAAPTA